MARINWLADVLRAAGCTVREDDTSWKTRGGSTFDPRGLIIHATAGGLAQGNDSAYNVLVNGRAGLAGPISQVMVERGTGRWRPVCSGRSNHALTGWGGNCSGFGNGHLIGIEFHHANTSAEPWTEAMLDNYARGAAAICRHMGWGVDRIALHKEHQPGDKSDTTFDGNAFRARVQRFLNPAPTPTPQQEDDMNSLVYVRRGAPAGQPQLWALAGAAAQPGGWVETDNGTIATGWAVRFGGPQQNSVDVPAADWEALAAQHRGASA